MGKLKITELEICGLKVIEPKYYEDSRGSSAETYSVKDLKECGIEQEFVLEYQSYSAHKNTLRGIHFQNNPHSQAKLVRVISGGILDVIVDLRKSSPTYKKWVSLTISAENRKQILIPKGFGHAFVALEDNTTVLYKLDDYYYPETARTILWNDPELAIKWGVENPLISEKDASAPKLCESDINY